YRVAGSLDPTAIKVAFVFVLIGYGTKAGVAPMHSWLPDAHAEAPTPVSAMLSANMLTVAVYAILRFKAVADRAVGAAFTGNLLIGLLSIIGWFWFSGHTFAAAWNPQGIGIAKGLGSSVALTLWAFLGMESA